MQASQGNQSVPFRAALENPEKDWQKCEDNFSGDFVNRAGILFFTLAMYQKTCRTKTGDWQVATKLKTKGVECSGLI